MTVTFRSPSPSTKIISNSTSYPSTASSFTRTFSHPAVRTSRSMVITSVNARIPEPVFTAAVTTITLTVLNLFHPLMFSALKRNVQSMITLKHLQTVSLSKTCLPRKGSHSLGKTVTPCLPHSSSHKNRHS